ncbi:uncharacterized protein LOC123685420 [Harmonia axyridis]|uniref:uncharacterized protein LOC123685420 n=1 Tax=Harmonia axyridis TaxID=115357 RepID=UPI001E277C5B|nr:uncharacterized protein LOC123685420 [Harmonia axyridis]
MFSLKVVVLFAITVCCVLSFVVGQDSAMDDFFMKASKNIPRIGRSNSKSSKGSNDDFENFFLKASKSVPRIGRRDRPEIERPVADYSNSDSDKAYSGLVLPLSELSKYNNFLTMEEIMNAYSNALEASAMKEKDRAKRGVN